MDHLFIKKQVLPVINKFLFSIFAKQGENWLGYGDIPECNFKNVWVFTEFFNWGVFAI